MIYITIPAHNEERTIGVLLWKIRTVMAEFARPYEVLVLDDGSTDETAEVLHRYAGVVPLHVIRPDERLGYGSATERLLREVVERSGYPKRDVAVTLQGDFSEDPTDLVGMVKTLEGGADLVAGRAVAGGQGPATSVRFSRRLAPMVLGKAFSRAPVSDPLSGFRAYRVIVLKKAMRALPEDQKLVASSDWGANLELLAKAAPYARRIEESPFSSGPVRRPRESRFRAIPSLKGLVRLRKTTWLPAQEGS